jgi:hypothetical protein
MKNTTTNHREKKTTNKIHNTPILILILIIIIISRLQQPIFTTNPKKPYSLAKLASQPNPPSYQLN